MPREDVCVRVYRAIHDIVADMASRGEYEFLSEGVGIDTVLDRLRDVARGVVEECIERLCSEGRVVSWISNGSRRVLPLEAYQVRSLLELVPYIDAKLVVERRRELLTVDGFEAASRVARAVCSEDRRCVKLVLEVFNELVGEARFLQSPYSYQAVSWRVIAKELRGSRRPVAISAGTGEGKTEAFFVPLLLYLAAARLENRRPRVAIVYPRKALAVDQLTRFIHYLRAVNRVLKRWGLEPIRLAIVDGDTRFFWSAREISEDLVEVSSVIHRYIACSRSGARLFIDGELLREVVRRDLAYVKDEIAVLSREGLHAASARLTQAIRRIESAIGGRGRARAWPRFVCRGEGVDEVIEWLGLTKSDLLFETPDILITNFETLSLRTLDPDFREFFEGLEALVIDEAHVVRSIRGVHVALAVRRVMALVRALRRCEPMLIVSSATLPDPEQLIKAFAPSRAPSSIVISSDSPEFRGSKVREFVYHLAVIPSGISPETAVTHVAIVLALSSRRHKVLVFTNKRRDAERIAKDVADRVSELASGRLGRLGIAIATPGSGSSCAPALLREDGALLLCDANSISMAGRVGEIRSSFHHAGLKREDRERIEREFREGRINILAATSTLEMGIDVGDVDAVTLFGTPPQDEDYRQRAGRGGSRGREPVGSYVVVTVIDSLSPRDIYFFAHFEDAALGRSKPRHVVDPSRNLRALAQHLALLAMALAAQLGEAHLSPSTLSALRLDPCKARRRLSKYVEGCEALEALLKELAPDLGGESLRRVVARLTRNTLLLVDAWLELACSADVSKEVRRVLRLAAAMALASMLPFVSHGAQLDLLRVLSKDLVSEASTVYRSLAEYGSRLIEGIVAVKPLAINTGPEPLHRVVVDELKRFVSAIQTFSSFAELDEGLLKEATRRLENVTRELRARLHRLLAVDAAMEELRRVLRSSNASSSLAPYLERPETPPLLTVFSIVSRAYLLQLAMVLELCGDRGGEPLRPEVSSVIEGIRRVLAEECELVPLQMVWGSRSSRTVYVSYDALGMVFEEPLLEALARYPPMSHSIVRNVVFEAQYLESSLEPVGSVVLDGARCRLLSPSRISMRIVEALSVAARRRAFRGRVRAFAWVDPRDWVYVSDRVSESERSLVSVGIVFVCPLCLCERVRSLFTRDLVPYYYPLTVRRERGSYAPVLMAIRRSDRRRFEAFIGPTVFWYPRIEDSPPPEETVDEPTRLVCPVHGRHAFLRATTPLRTYPRFRDLVVDRSLVDYAAGKGLSMGYHYARVARVLESVSFILEGNHYSVSMVRAEPGGDRSAIGLHFPTTYLSLELVGERDDLGRPLEREARRAYWWWVYHELLQRVTEMLRVAEERHVSELSFLDPSTVTGMLVRALQGVYVALRLGVGDVDAVKGYVREVVWRSSRSRGYSPYLGTLVERIVSEVCRRVLGRGFGVVRFGQLFQRIHDEIERVVSLCVDAVQRAVNVPPRFLAYVALHTLSHAVARRMIEDAALDPMDLAMVCSRPGSTEVGMYELFEGGAGVLHAFFEEYRRDPALFVAEAGRVVIECPRNRVRALMDHVLHPSMLSRVREAVREGVSRLVELVEGLTGARLSAGMVSKIVWLGSDPERLVGAATVSLLVRSLEALLSADFDPRLVAMVLRHRNAFHRLTESVLSSEWRALLDAARGLGLSVRSVDDLRNLALKLIESRGVGAGRGPVEEVSSQRVVIVIEEVAPIHVDGCWMCLNVPSCIHGSPRSYTLQPYLSAGLMKVLIETLS